MGEIEKPVYLFTESLYFKSQHVGREKGVGRCIALVPVYRQIITEEEMKKHYYWYMFYYNPDVHVE